jgi:putative MATE family efflux protein
MKNSISYKYIFALALPIIFGSAVQNIIAVTDSVFLYHYNELDFQAISIASVLYLIVSAIGFGFSRGGQIIIARYKGANNIGGIKKAFYSLVIFELFLASFMFFLLQLFPAQILGLVVDDPILLEKGVEYILFRSYGVFFSYVGVALIAYYTGITKPAFIVVDTLVLLIVNLVFNYVLIFGNWGFEAMGMAGAGLASSIAEFAAFITFIVYMLLERNPVVPKIFSKPVLEVAYFKDIYKISINIVLQVIVSLGSYLIFFGIIENLGRYELGVSNLIRLLYLLLSVPSWGFASAMNTISSNLCGADNLNEIIPVTHRVAILNVGLTMLLSIPILVFPEQLLYPLFGKQDMSLIQNSQPMFYMLIVIMFLFSLGSIYFDSIIGLGKTRWGFYVKLCTSVSYLLLLYYIVEYTGYGLKMAWATEIFYWILIIAFSYHFLFIRKWKNSVQILST